MSKLIFGCGYLGRRVARRWLDDGHVVYVVTRSTERADGFSDLGLRPIVGDLTKPGTLEQLPPVETVLFAVGFDRRAGQSIREVYVDGLANALAKLPPDVGRFIYISSTGVYAQSDGQWVDEQSPCEPQREGGQACLDAERLLAQHPIGERTNVLRLAGIYGPGRVPSRNDLTAQRAIAAPSHGHLNLIHVDDAATVVLTVEQYAITPRTYLVSDGTPVLRRDYYRELANLWDLPEPQFDELRIDSPAALRAGSDKRIRNKRLVDELRVTFEYPSYREGLRAIVESERS